MSKWWGRTLNTIYLTSVIRNSGDGLIHTVQPEEPKRPGGKRKAYRRREANDDRIPAEACLRCITPECNGGELCFKVLSYPDYLRFRKKLDEMMRGGMTIREVMDETGMSRYMVTRLLDGYYPWLIEDQEKIKKYLEGKENA